MIQNIIFDFDSSFLSRESIEILVETGLEKMTDADRRACQAELGEVFSLTEAGKISRGQKIVQQLKIARIHPPEIQIAANRLQSYLLPGVVETLNCLLAEKKNIILFSRGIDQMLLPLVDQIGIPRENLFANQVIYQPDQAVGVDETNPLFLLNGKVFLAESLKNQQRLTGLTAVVGNCGADLSIQKSGIADYFIYFPNLNIDPAVRKDADFTIENFTQLRSLICVEPQRKIQSGQIQSGNPEPPVEYKIVLLENIHPIARERFANARYAVEHVKSAATRENLLELSGNCDVLGIRSKTRVTGENLPKMPHLLSIGCFCIGTDQVDLKTAASLGIPVFNAPYANTRSVAELVMGCVVMLMRGVFEKSVAAHAGQWLKQTTFAREIRGKTIGIIGYGHIGSQVSILLENLGMQVIFFDIMDKLPLGNARRMASLAALLQASDVVTLHVPDTPLTRGMLGAAELNLMKPGSVLINTSRGKVVDLAALKIVLESDRLLGAAIDVFPEEPASAGDPFSSVLQNLPNVILTPHIGGSTIEAQENIALEVSSKLENFLKTGATPGAVNFPEVELAPTPNSRRILYTYRNIPGILEKIHGIFAQRRIRVQAQILQTRDTLGYMIIDIERDHTEHVPDLLNRLTETIKVRQID